MRQARALCRLPAIFAAMGSLAFVTACGGGAITSVPLAPVAAAPCAAYAAQPAAPGSSVTLSASDAAAFPNGASCSALASLRNGAFLIAPGVPESEVDAVVGLDTQNADTASETSGAVTTSEPLSAVAFGLDEHSALTELVVAGDPADAQPIVDGWIGGLKTSARTRKQTLSTVTSAWTPLLTRNETDSRAGFSRITSIYRLNSADTSADDYLVNSKVVSFKGTIAPAPTLQWRSTRVRAGASFANSDLALFDHGPNSLASGTASYTVGGSLSGSGSANAGYSISWLQPGVQTLDQSTATVASWLETPSFDAPGASSGLSSYNSAIFRLPNQSPRSLHQQIFVHATSEAEFTSNDFAVIDSGFSLQPPRFSVGIPYQQGSGANALIRLQLFADNGNGGALGWTLINTPDYLTVVPSQGSGDTLLTLVPKSGAPSRVLSVLEFQTNPPNASPDAQNKTLYALVPLP